MRALSTLLIFLTFTLLANSQVRNGWRSVFDKAGRLARMSYYENGKCLIDSNLFFQYHTDNIPKGIVTGEIAPSVGCLNGSISLFDHSGMLSSFNIKRGGELVYDVNCDYFEKCTSIWRELFDSNSGFWDCDSFSVQNSELIIHNNKSVGVAVFNPKIPIDFSNSFACKLVIPVEGNSAKQGIALGWENSDNYYLVELMFGKYYTIQYWDNGEYFAITDGRQEIEKMDAVANEIVLKRNNQNLIFELNGVIEKVLPIPNFKGEKIALVTRARGNAHFSDFILKYDLIPGDAFYDKHWLGKGTGFFVSKTGKIFTTFENVMDAKSIRVRGKMNNKEFVLPAKIVRTDESNNLAVLQIIDKSFAPFENIPFGYTNHVPVSESKVFCIGYPNAISGIYMAPEVFEGKILSGTASSSGNRMMEIDFRNGMIGAPVFDFDFNFLGIYSMKGIELKYSEMIDFYNNSRLFIANMGRADRELDSPLVGKTYQEKYNAGAAMVVIIETSVFDLEGGSRNDEFDF